MTSEAPGVIRLADGVVDLAAGRVYRADRLARLTQSEVVLLDALARARGQVLARDVLSEEIGAADASRAVDMAIHRLRGKLEREPGRPTHLITAHGEGYRLIQAERPAARTNLEPVREPMVGRDTLLAAVGAALERPPHRAVLVGPAGVGKTRLAQQIAEDAALRWAFAGCWWVDLADVDDGDGAQRVLERIAAVARVDLDGVDPGGLGAVLSASGPVLVVLDTCERCADAAGAAASALGDVRVLATSRGPVGGLPELEVPPLSASDAEAVLVGRARALGVTAGLPEGLVREVVDAVDRLPLGLELAAARLTALPIVRVAAELGRSQRILSDRSRPGRHTSAAASVAWSWDALDPADREALVRLSVPWGPIDDALATALLEDVGAVARLARSHLLRPVEGGLAPWHAVRELALARAAPAVRDAAERDHAAWFGQRAAASVPDVWTPRYPAVAAWAARYEADLDLVVARGGPEDAAAAATLLGELDLDASRPERGLARVVRAPAAPGLLELASRLRGALGRWEAALVDARAALAAAQAAPERSRARATLATALHRNHQPAAAVAEQALAEADGDRVGRARALGALLTCRLADPTCDTVALAQRAYDAVLEGGVVRFEPLAASNLWIARAQAGDLAAVDELAAAVPRIRRRRSQGVVWMTLALHAIPVDLERALDLAQRGVEAFTAAGAVDGRRAMIGLAAELRALLGAPEVDVRADLAEHAQGWEAHLARPGAAEDPNVASYWLCEGNTLAALGQRDAAAAAFAASRRHLPAYLGVSDAACDALIAGWLARRPLDPAAAAELAGPYPGARVWVQLQLLRQFLAR